jgi:DNA helicase-2/ATP-dependent DNA helicase PcrA
MPEDDLDLLAIDRGCVTAPAGCGKTHKIVDTLLRYRGTKRVLVVTHTNAGVAALRERLVRAKVPPSSYTLATVDGWAMRLASTFPVRSSIDPAVLRLDDHRSDYPKIREAASHLLANGSLQDLVAATYSRLIVDEYQDCSALQHQFLVQVSEALPTCVLGDPMQAIFGFGADGLPDWNGEVCRRFPLAGTLNTPWRWINAGTEGLGRWLLLARDSLLSRQPIDIAAAPDGVRWVELDGVTDRQKQHSAALTRPPGGIGTVLVIGDSSNPKSQRLFASQTPGAVMVEAVDLRDFVEFAERFDVDAEDAIQHLLEYGQQLMTGTETPRLLARLNTLIRGTARRPATAAESAGLAFLDAPSHARAASLLDTIRVQTGVSAHRPLVLRACLAALRACGAGNGTFADQAMRERERYRATGRALPSRAVGSTLLLKGLEAEVVVILDGPRHDSKNLYVAMTRGSKLVVVCSPTPTLNPR